jgi:hypothetical protein
MSVCSLLFAPNFAVKNHAPSHFFREQNKFHKSFSKYDFSRGRKVLVLEEEVTLTAAEAMVILAGS